MNHQLKVARQASQVFIILSILGMLCVSLIALYNPQVLMDYVEIRLTTTDAYSAIRGIYGGGGLSMVGMLLYLLLCHVRLGIAFLCLLLGLHTFTRIITICIDGPLSPSGHWSTAVEAVFFIISVYLFAASKRKIIQEQQPSNL